MTMISVEGSFVRAPARLEFTARSARVTFFELILHFLRSLRFLFFFLLSFPCFGGENLYLQKTLEDEFHSDAASVLMLETGTGNVIASYHAAPLQERAYPPGSLIKVFTAIAYYTNHTTFPVYHCPKTLADDPGGCWDRNGHGRTDIIHALSNSCNVYFRQLARETSPAAFRAVLQQVRLLEDETEVSRFSEEDQRKIMVGNTNAWSVSPVALARAYGFLFRDSGLPDELLDVLRRGLMAGGREGTSAEAGKIANVALLGKTGTTLRTVEGQTDWRNTQGWWIGLYPPERPEITTLVFVPRGRGAWHAAPRGGKALAAYLRITRNTPP